MLSTTTPVTSELASTHTVTLCPLMHQSPCARLICTTLVMMSFSICLRRWSCSSSSQSAVTAFAHYFMNVVTMQSQPHTRRCPVNFPCTEKMVQQVSTADTKESLPSKFTSQICKPSTYSCSGSLLVSLYVGCRAHTFINILLMYKDVALLMVLSCATTVLIMDRMIDGAILSPNPEQVRQYLSPLITSV